MLNRSLCLFALLPLSVAHAGSGTVFQEIKQALYEYPRGANLPAYPGLVPSDVIHNFLSNSHSPGYGLGIQSRRILIDESDVRDTKEPKWLHPRGACAEARWIITEESAATGLFAKGVNVPSLVRISSGDGASEFPTKGRIFGMAVKLFSSDDPLQPSKTTNIITLDQVGFDRSVRKYVFFGDKPEEKIYFTNVAPARSALGKFLSTFFDRFDKPNFARPVYATAGTQMGGSEVQNRVTPYEIRFVPEEAMERPKDVFSDFRLELQEKRQRVLKIVIQSFDGKSQIQKVIGRLELGDFTVTDFCDLDLHFHHSAIEDQWNKYLDYSVVKDLKK